MGQGNLFSWVNGIVQTTKIAADCQHQNYKTGTKHQIYPAYTVAELGEMLPQATETSLRGTRWHCLTHLCSYIGIANTEADARVLMLIYLLENKLIQP